MRTRQLLHGCDCPGDMALCMRKVLALPRSCSVCFSAEIVRVYLTIIPRARMGSESIAHEAEGRMGY